MTTAPSPIRGILRHPTTGILARVVLTCPFWISACQKLADWPGAVAEMQHFGLAPAGGIAALVILVQLAGSAAVIAGAWTWLGAGVLGGFTVLATILAHDFWNAAADAAFHQMNTFFEHLSMVAGLALAAILADATPRDPGEIKNRS